MCKGSLENKNLIFTLVLGNEETCTKIKNDTLCVEALK